ncbi:hypothetical protein AAL_07934 [Moelleriella libera RCEF 2490]|uniref:Uncharacterized protein n=1 Tax=Moelleriella libera RCEF 2490 TaxID=1081109 RepID=A0A167WL29_9HYPO|nr:hypothetical protein AAL_07934 [Moelleriella libera RCEF 2490]
MFGAFPVNPNLPAVDPQDIPPPTPVLLPRYQPYASDNVLTDHSLLLPSLLESTGRESVMLGPDGLLAIGLDLKLDAELRDLVPAASSIPNFHKWECLTAEQAQSQAGSDRTTIRTGGKSPGSEIYLERKRELANTNEDAFRTVRRIAAPRGKQQARLGNAYEFFRCLELFTSFWDDPSQPAELPPSPELSTSGEQHPVDTESSCGMRNFSGESMPPEYRQDLSTAFIKLVAYDFGCNVSPARAEPRLHLTSPPGQHQRKSYTSSKCQFVFQSPMSREAARAGHIYGPVAAVSARPTVNFTLPDPATAQSLDLAREIVTALVTAQHRNREGKEEVRFGQDKWWATRQRWGGGSGGPIGREVDTRDASVGHEAPPGTQEDKDGPVMKRARKTLPIYDKYRMVRPPSSTWDRKAKYEAIGKVKGAAHDDIFVVSSLFHHVSILRVRVPLRLLDVLAGSPEPDVAKRSWGKVDAWRSPWYDLFDIDQRIAAMRCMWAVMAYQMRDTAAEEETGPIQA